ncbi:hypothetical protein F441_03768 [Phytophthora nicotianae CJ01A1]|uniref:Uncharacterized protein n=4 Tax=Phytophthora nicotianae TaxID=4792 RepID=V9FS59_PHYNI|nr:hypothetical protein F443_03785 [Phytophthora nicotianae P1569]ETO81898.1 hypothetical protein F444_03866 [Phytophthora nicotianae P1976]ETP23021.1 hypothetical protein F441_03768 [Phytophthora nicotianae CJ01A1]ETP51021.1 hypothetical protein F442_03770 [Phytophthora nicotianae P10297]
MAKMKTSTSAGSKQRSAKDASFAPVSNAGPAVHDDKPQDRATRARAVKAAKLQHRKVYRRALG